MPHHALPCPACGTTFVPTKASAKTCSISCGRRLYLMRTGRGFGPEQRLANYRAKNHRRRSTGRYTDITPAYERALRRKAKRCPLCHVRMVDTPYLPTSKELDHIVPLGARGTHTVGNVRIICRACNLARPKDGSDYTGPVTLWAQMPGFMPKLSPRPQAQACAPSPRPRRARCEHGVPTYYRCHRCQPDPTACRDCGSHIDQPGRGRPRQWCTDCRPSAYAARKLIK